MSSFSSFIIGFCSVCVLVGMLYILCPNGVMSKPVKYVFSLCFICCIIAGSLGIKQIDFDQIPSTENKSFVTEEMAELTAEQIFGSALAAQNIDFRKIDVITDKLDDGSISIIEVIVYSSATPEEINRVISSDDYEVRVINE